MSVPEMAVSMGEGFTDLNEKVFSQGLQVHEEVEEREEDGSLKKSRRPLRGLFCTALKRDILAFLFMDDTTLVAESEDQLRKLVARYVNFCNMFRMRLNPEKSNIGPQN